MSLRDSGALPGRPPRRAGGGWRRASPRLVLGLGLVLLGILFTCDNMGVLDAGEYLRFWPALLLAFGGLQVLTAAQTSQRVGGAVWAFVGGWLLLDEVGVVRCQLWDLWPLLLVFLGGSFVLRALRPRQAQAEGGDAVHSFALMSGVTRRSSSPAFAGGSLTAVMGGVELDLREARLPPGGATLDAFAMWGGIEIRVPPSWAVEGRVLPLMGGFEDSTAPPAPEDATGTLVVTGTAIMGGVEIKN